MCCRGTVRGETLVATAQRDRASGSIAGRSSSIRAGVLVCQQSDSALTIAYADDAFCATLGLPSSESIAGAPLFDVLPPGSTDASERVLSSGAAAGLPIHLTLGSEQALDGFELVLTPAAAHGLWLGRFAAVRRARPGSNRAVAPATELPVKTTRTALLPFADALDATRALIAIRDSDDRYVLVNSALAEFLGRPREELVGATYAELAVATGPLLGPPSSLPPDGTPAITRNVELTDAIGRRRHFDVRRQVVRYADGQPYHVIEIAMELAAGGADADETTEVTAASFARLPPFTSLPEHERAAVAQLIAALPAASFRCVTTPELELTSLDDGAEQLFGKPARELIGHVEKLLAYAVDDMPATRAARWGMLAAEGRPWDEEIEILDANGEARWLRVLARHVDGEYVGFLLDVTRPNVFETRLQDVERQLDVALTNGEIGLVDWHIDSDRVVFNPQLSKLLELDDSAPIVTGRQLASLAHPKDKARVHMELQAHLAGETSQFVCEYRLKTGRGRWRWVLATGRVVEHAPGGQALRYVGTLKDVTEPLETEQKLERQVARSEQVSQMSTQLEREVRQLEAEIREISEREQERIGRDLHDGLGQELTGVSLLLKSLEQATEREAPQLGPRVHSVRDLVEQCIVTTRALAQGLTAVNLDRDGLAGALKQLAASTEAVYDIPVRFSAQTSGSSLGVGAATDLYRIAGEALTNAAKHSCASEILVDLKTDGESVEISVEDDGVGIPEVTTTGTGLGLKIMHYRASIIGASLDIGPREGGGTVVRCVWRAGARQTANGKGG